VSWPQNFQLVASVAGGLLGVGLVAIAWWRAWRPSAPSLADATSAFLAGGAVPQGVRVCALAVSPDLPAALSDVALYVFLGGVSLIWVSIDVLVQVSRSQRTRRTTTQWS
jgi:hypothetical protein